MSKSGTTVSFKYNASGLRTCKIVNGIVTKYTLHGKNVVHMTRGNDNLHFFYDVQNRPAVVVYNGTAYAYVKNLQGDIIAILDNTGTAVVSYTYDAWGTPTGTTGTMAETLGRSNPFRHRGYVYDEETGLYYLRSRYYDATWARFCTHDMYIIKCERFGANGFVYAVNTPVTYYDPNGTCASCIQDEESMTPEDYFTYVIRERLEEFISSPNNYTYNLNTVYAASFNADGTVRKTGSIACGHLMLALTKTGSYTMPYRYTQVPKDQRGKLFDKDGNLTIELKEGMEVFKTDNDKEDGIYHVGMLILWDFGYGEEWAVIQSASVPVTLCRALFKNDKGPNITSFYEIKERDGRPYSDWDYYTLPRY